MLIKEVTQYIEQDISTAVPEKEHALKSYGKGGGGLHCDCTYSQLCR
jgi:hypothetical protein